MRCLAIVLFIACTSLPCFAQNSEQYRTCGQTANTQAAMDKCANEEAARVDSKLNSIYRKLLSKAATQPAAVGKIKAAEKAWIAYRSAYIEAMYPAEDKQGEYGTMFPIEADLLYAELTEQHVVALRQILREYVHPGLGR